MVALQRVLQRRHERLPVAGHGRYAAAVDVDVLEDEDLTLSCSFPTILITLLSARRAKTSFSRLIRDVLDADTHVYGGLRWLKVGGCQAQSVLVERVLIARRCECRRTEDAWKDAPDISPIAQST